MKLNIKRIMLFSGILLMTGQNQSNAGVCSFDKVVLLLTTFGTFLTGSIIVPPYIKSYCQQYNTDREKNNNKLIKRFSKAIKNTNNAREKTLEYNKQIEELQKKGQVVDVKIVEQREKNKLECDRMIQNMKKAVESLPENNSDEIIIKNSLREQLQELLKKDFWQELR